MKQPSAAVIGAGFGGIALAIRLQAAGIATTLVDKRDKPGGRAYFWEKDGFTFDAGPTCCGFMNSVSCVGSWEPECSDRLRSLLPIRARWCIVP